MKPEPPDERVPQMLRSYKRRQPRPRRVGGVPGVCVRPWCACGRCLDRLARECPWAVVGQIDWLAWVVNPCPTPLEQKAENDNGRKRGLW